MSDILKKMLVVIVLSIIPALHIEPSLTFLSGYDAGVRSYITVAPARTSAAKPERKKKKSKKKVDKYKITAYCPCRKCSEGYGNNTSTGVKAKEGRTIAVDPSVIPYGTKVHIKGMGDFIAEDCGGDVKGKHVDIYFESHKKTVKFGVKMKKVKIITKGG